MKNNSFLLLIAICTLAIFSCGKTDDTKLQETTFSPLGGNVFSPCLIDEDLAIDSIPPAIVAYFVTNLPTATIDEAELLGANEIWTHIVIETVEEIEYLFDIDGNFISEGADVADVDIAITDLPAVITDYIAANHPDTNIDEASTEVEFGITFYEVELSDDTELIFDSEGSFLCAEEENNHHDNDDDDYMDDDDMDDDDMDDDDMDDDNMDDDDMDDDDMDDDDMDDDDMDDDNMDDDDMDDDDMDDDDMDDDDMDDDDMDHDDIDPAVIQLVIDYITTNYPDNTVKDVELKNEEIYVELNNGVKVVFDLAGNFLREE